MIFDLITNIDFYKPLSIHLKKGIAQIKRIDLNSLTDGKFEIDGNDAYASVSSYQTRQYNEANWEAHKKYIDIQIITKGSEKIYFYPVSEMVEVVKPYDEVKDIQFFKGNGNYVTLKPGYFAIFFPSDAHQPCIINENEELVKKIVFKIKI